MTSILTDAEIAAAARQVNPEINFEGFARSIEQAILAKLNSAEPRSYLYKHHYYDGSFVFSHKDTLNGSPCIEAIPLYEHPPAPSAVEAERDALKAALEKLACLGNGDSYGNSMSNCIAQEALANVKE